jgi:hypothetical protein
VESVLTIVWILQVGAQNMSGTTRGTQLPTPVYLRRKAASEYLLTKYGFGGGSTLTNLASLGGGPPFHKAGRTVLYTASDLDAWAQAKIVPVRRSTSDTGAE